MKNSIIVWQYVLMYNEMRILPFMVNYWRTYADKVIIIDSYSNDGSLEYLRSIKDLDIEIREYDSNNQLNDENHRNIKNECWKEAKGKADFVVVSDFDETIVSKNGTNIKEVLKKIKEKGETIIKMKGYNLFTENFPEYKNELLHTYEKNVVYTSHFSKNIVFNPNEIKEINYSVGGHFSEPIGNVKWKEDNEIIMLHIHNLGLYFKCEHYLKGRKRLSQYNIEHKMGIEYFNEEEKIKAEFLADWKKRINIDNILN